MKPKLVAVYGSLRSGLGNHRVLGGSKLIGTDRISGWEMFSLGGFPGIRSGDGSIVIEVYEVVSSEVDKGLDRLEGYYGPGESNFYDKAVVETKYGQASIYTLEGNNYFGNQQVEDGDWVEHLS